MSRPKILQENESYTFRSYFEMNEEIDRILAELGYQFSTERLSLPQVSQELDFTADLKQRLERLFPLIRLSNETSRRELLVSPILVEIALFCQCQVRIEYPLKVSDWLKGNLDYFLHLNRNFLVIEAKNDDLSRGFTQLSAELIALSQAEDCDVLYGAVTIGNLWQFGKLDRTEKRIIQDIELFKVPGDLDLLVRVLVGILRGENESE
ncbi:MAG: hypothetical protein SWY16_19655 [Cyanobacteriota bacterium]|nr:hypothetical protein [Cyanobacteriota bacterium]